MCLFGPGLGIPHCRVYIKPWHSQIIQFTPANPFCLPEDLPAPQESQMCLSYPRSEITSHSPASTLMRDSNTPVKAQRQVSHPPSIRCEWAYQRKNMFSFKYSQRFMRDTCQYCEPGVHSMCTRGTVHLARPNDSENIFLHFYSSFFKISFLYFEVLWGHIAVLWI